MLSAEVQVHYCRVWEVQTLVQREVSVRRHFSVLPHTAGFSAEGEWRPRRKVTSGGRMCGHRSSEKGTVFGKT